MATQTLNKNKDDISTESPNANTSELEITRQTLQVLFGNFCSFIKI